MIQKLLIILAIIQVAAGAQASPPPPLPPAPVVARLRRCAHFWWVAEDGGYLHKLTPDERRTELHACLPYVVRYSQPYVELAYTAAWFGVDVRANTQRIAESYRAATYANLDGARVDTELRALWVQLRRRCVLAAMLDIPAARVPDSNMCQTEYGMLSDHPKAMLLAASGNERRLKELARTVGVANVYGDTYPYKSGGALRHELSAYIHGDDFAVAAAARSLLQLLPGAVRSAKRWFAQDDSREFWTDPIPAPHGSAGKASFAQQVTVLCRESMPGDDPDAQARLNHLIAQAPVHALKKCLDDAPPNSATEAAAAFQLAMRGYDVRGNVQRLACCYITGGGGDMAVFIPQALVQLYQRGHERFILQDLLLVSGGVTRDASLEIQNALTAAPKQVLEMAATSPVTRDQLIWSMNDEYSDPIPQLRSELKRLEGSAHTAVAVLAQRCLAALGKPCPN